MLLSLFKRRKDIPPPSNALDEKSFETTLSDKRWLATVWRLTSLSRAEFDATYQEFLQLASQMLGQSKDLDRQLVDDQTEERLMLLIVAILKVRMARIMPRVATLEDAARMSEAMSFALVIACVMEPIMTAWRQADPILKKESICPLVDSFEGAELMPRKPALESGAALLFLPAVLSPIAMRWLWKEPFVLNELVRFFQGKGHGELRQVIDLARHKAGLSKQRETEPSPASANDPNGRVEESDARLTEKAVREPESPPDEPKASATPLPQIENAPQSKRGESQGHQQGELLPKPKSKKTPKVGPDFVGWMRARIEAGQLIANEADSDIHVLSDGYTFVKMPYLLNRFADESGQRPKHLQNRLSRKGAIRKRLDGRNLFYAKHASEGTIAGVVLAHRNALWNEQMPPSEYILKVLTERQK